MIFLGRYDGQVYVHNRLTGETSWTFQTGAAVKSSLCIDPLMGVAWFRSHDHYLYALDVTYKRYISTTHCSASLDVLLSYSARCFTSVLTRGKF